MSSPRSGDHLVSSRTGYQHHGLYLGEHQVIHYLGFSAGELSGQIAITSLLEFCQGHGYRVMPYATRGYSREESIDRAYSRLGEAHYNTLLNNCEHFVRWCIEGFHYSGQIHQLIAADVLAQQSAKALLTHSRLPTTAVANAMQSRSVPVPHTATKVFASPTTRSETGMTAASAAIGTVLVTSAAPLATALAGGTLTYLALRQAWRWLKN